MMKFSYVPPSLEVLNQNKESPRDFDQIFKSGYPVLKLKERTEPYRLRILPPTWRDIPDYSHIQAFCCLGIYIHYNIGIDNGMFVCQNSLNHSTDCFLCSEYNRLIRGGDKVNADKLKASACSIAYAINREEEAKGPQIWKMTSMLRTDIFNLTTDKETKEQYYVDNPEKGYDVFVTRTGSTKEKTRWRPELSRHASPLSTNPDTMEKWINFTMEKPLPGCLNFYPDAYIKEIYDGKRKCGSFSTFVERNTEPVKVGSTAQETLTPSVTVSVSESPTVSVGGGNEPQQASFRRPMRQ